MMDGGVAVLPHAFGGLAPPRVPSWCRGVLARVLLAGDAPVRDWRVVCRQTEDRFEGHVAVEATVVAENKLVEVGVEVLTAKPMIRPEAPALQEREHPMNPLEGNVRRHVADNAGIVAVFGEPEIGGMPVRDQRRARRDVRFDEGVDGVGMIAGNGSEPEASGQGVEVFSAESLGSLRLSGGPVDDLDGADDDDLTGLERAVGAVVGTQRHFGLVHFDHALQRVAIGIDHRPPQLLRKQPGCAVGKPELPLQLLRRHAVGMGGHEVGCPEPYRQRQLGPVHHRPGRHRGLPAAGDTLTGISPTFQQAGPRPSAFGAHEAARPPRREQVPRARRFVRKSLLKLEESGLLRGHGVGS